MQIRSETPSDYAHVAEIHALAFETFLEDPMGKSFISEVALVDALRHGSNYEPSLSLVAEIDGSVVGHAFFYPFNFYVGGKALRGVSLGPIGVHPAHQRRGIGAALMQAGHRRADGLDCQFAFLLGHPDYYPRFGYRTDMFGECRLEFARAEIPALKVTPQARLVRDEDVPWLARTWKTWFEDVDLALYPGESLLDWITHNAAVTSYMVWLEGKRLGYLRYKLARPAEPMLFLPADPGSAGRLLAYLASLDKQAQTFRLPLHPASRAVQAWQGAAFETKISIWKAAMIKVLDEGSPECAGITAYCEEVAAGTRQPGCLIYPPQVEVAT